MFNSVEPIDHGESNGRVSPSSTADGGSVRIKTACFIANVLNGAFETGLNPAWFEVRSLNENGFLDAVWEGKFPKTNAPARSDWSLWARLNADEVAEDEEADTPWTSVTAAVCVERWKAYARRQDLTAHARRRFVILNAAIELHELGLHDEGSELYGNANFDGVDEDCFAQTAIGGEVIYG